MPSNPVDGDAQSMHFGRVIRHINPVRLFLHLSWLPVIPSPWFQHRYTHSPPLLQGISYRPWSWLWLWHDGEEYDEYIRSGTISARLGKVLILYHYLFKSAVIRLLNPSLVCSFHWPILLLICIVRYCYLRPMVPSIRYSIIGCQRVHPKTALLMSWQPTISQPFLAVHQGPWCAYHWKSELGHLFSYRSSK